jgi:hypothetical protein
MQKNNKITIRTHSLKHKEILKEAAKRHYSGSLSGYIKQWVVVICRLIQAGVSAEWMIANIDKVIKFCNNGKE